MASMDCLSYPGGGYQKQPIIQSTGLVVKWGQVILDTSSLDIPIDPIHRPDIVIDQNNHDLAVRVSENGTDANSV